MKSYSLLAYTRRPTTGDEANDDDIAASLHMALRERADGNWRPLNDNYGIMFAAAVPVEGTAAESLGAATASALIRDREPAATPTGARDDTEPSNAAIAGQDTVLKSLKDPYIFRMGDGTFGIVCTRTALGGQSDGSERDSLLFVTSDDLLTFTQWGQLHFDTTDGVHRPAARFREDEEDYEITWVNDDGHVCHAILGDPTEPTQTGKHVECEPVPSWWQDFFDPHIYDPERFGIPDCVPGNTISMSVAEVELLIDRFGRIYNTATWAPRQLVQSQVDTLDEARGLLHELDDVRAKLRYSDDSRTTRAVDWHADEFESLAEALASGSLQTGDQWQIAGEIRHPKYPVPFAAHRADPSIVRYDTYGEPLFLFLARDDADDRLYWRYASSIMELSDDHGGLDTESALLHAGCTTTDGQVLTGRFRSSSMINIDECPTMLLSAVFDDGSTGCVICQLEYNGDGKYMDPRIAQHWTSPQLVRHADGTPLDGFHMTAFVDDDHWYYTWQYRDAVWIAPFDPAEPSRLTDDARQIVLPEFAWEAGAAGAPAVTVHDDTVYLLYSGAQPGADCTTGLAMAPAGMDEDLRDPAVWTKLDYPILHSDRYNGKWELGPGHGMWSVDEDGNPVFVFQTAHLDDDGTYRGFDAQVHRVHWSEHGMPILDMQRKEELDPAMVRVIMDIMIE